MLKGADDVDIPINNGFRRGITFNNFSRGCAPEDINQSSFLEPVEGCLRIAKPEELEYANSYDPNILNQDALYEWLYVSA